MFLLHCFQTLLLLYEDYYAVLVNANDSFLTDLEVCERSAVDERTSVNSP